jgi:hypothetical protein
MSHSGLTRCLREMQHRASNGNDVSCRRQMAINAERTFGHFSVTHNTNANKELC